MASLSSTTRRLRFALVVLLLGTSLAAVPAATVSAAPPIVVNTTMDALHGSNGSGCVTAGGACSLRDAVLYANAHANTTISVPPGVYKLTIPPSGGDLGTTGDLNLLADMTINGAGAGATTIDGSVIADGIFHVSFATVTLTGLTLANGLQSSASATGGGALNISHDSQVTISDCVLSNNKIVGVAGAVGAPGGFALGGAIYTDGVLIAIRDTFTANTAQGGAGGDGNNAGGDGFGGAIEASAQANIVLIQDSTFAGNLAKGGPGGSGSASIGGTGGVGKGGAIVKVNSQISVTGSTFVGNSASGGAGGTGSGEFAIQGDAGGTGGGASGGALAGDAYSVGNTTFVSNTATGGNGGNGGIGTTMGNGGGGGSSYGGAISFEAIGNDVTNATIDGNSALSGVGGIGGGSTHGAPGSSNYGGISSNGMAYLTNTIVSNNIAGFSGNCSFGVVNRGHNLQFNPNSGCGDTPFAVGDPKLTPLGNYGGPTKTRGIGPGSAALDAGDDTTCGSSPVAGVDQRGIRRPQGAHCDIGAYEYAIVTTPPPSRPGPVMSGSPNAVPTARPGTGGGSGIPNPIPMPRQ